MLFVNICVKFYKEKKYIDASFNEIYLEIWFRHVW